MADLLDRQWELTNATTDPLVMGPRTPYIIQPYPEFAALDIRAADTDIPNADGIRMGRDYRASRSITFTITVDSRSAGDALEKASLLESAWLGDDVRLRPGEVSALTYYYAGRHRTVYGRGRAFAPDTTLYMLGRVDCTAEFKCVDHLSYGDERTVSVGLTAELEGGAHWPIGWPIIWNTVPTEGQGSFTVNGTQPSWLPITIYGPITNPVVSVTGLWSVKLDLSLAYDEYVDIDPRPWSRSVLLNGSSNVAGAITPDSPRLSTLQVPNGQWVLALSGTDVTRTARAEARVRDAFAGF